MQSGFSWSSIGAFYLIELFPVSFLLWITCARADLTVGNSKFLTRRLTPVWAYSEIILCPLTCIFLLASAPWFCILVLHPGSASWFCMSVSH